MKPIVLATAFLAGVTAHAGMYHLLLHQRRSEHLRRDRFFAITAFWLLLYDLFCIGLYGSDTVAEGRSWQRMQLFTIAFAGQSFLYYVGEFVSDSRAFRAARRVAWVFPILGAITLFERRGWLLRDEPKITRVDVPLLGEIVYHEAAAGPLQTILGSAALYVPAFVLAVAIQLGRRGERRRARVLGAGAGLFALAVVNDGLVTNGVIDSVYLIEWAWTAVIVLMGYSLSEEIVEGARAKEDLAEARLRLLRSERLESIGRLAGGIAHDLNNMLTPVVGYAQLVQQRMPPGSRESAHLRTLVDAAQRAAALARKLLALGRKQVLEVKPLDVGENVRGVEPLLRSLLPENVALSVDVDADLPRVDADAAQLEQVWVNLAANARDAMRDGGSLRFELRLSEPRSPRGVDVYVTDTGAGMSAGALEHVFEPFFTTKARGEGTGLGLSIVQGIVEQHGGRIEIARSSPAGTTFHLFLPATTREAEPEPRPLSGIRLAGGREQLIVVEDDEAVRALVADVLCAQGYDVVTAGSEHELRAALAARTAPVHLVITDVVLPDTDATKVFAVVAARYPSARFLYMTGHADEFLGARGMLRERIAILRKPFTTEELVRSVREALETVPAHAPGSGGASSMVRGT